MNNIENVKKLKNILAETDIQIYKNNHKLDVRVKEIRTLARERNTFCRWVIDLADFFFLTPSVLRKKLQKDAEYQRLVQENNRLWSLSEKTFKELSKELKSK